MGCVFQMQDLPVCRILHFILFCFLYIFVQLIKQFVDWFVIFVVLKNAFFAKSNMMFDTEDTSGLMIRLLKMCLVNL